MTTAQPDPIAASLLARLPDSPDAYVQKFDFVRYAALVIQLDASGYRAASFLDDRVLRPPTPRGAWFPIPVIVRKSQDVATARPLRFIFHTGHVGSTLVSRLLDETGAVLSLREPFTLRQLAEEYDSIGELSALVSPEQHDALLACCLRLWSRGYDTTRCAVVKATSMTGRLAPAIFAKNADLRGIYLNLRAEPYLATLLAGQNSHTDLRGLAVERFKRLQSLGAGFLAPLYALSLGELAAMSWLAETCSQHAAIGQLGARMLAVDFEDLLGDVPAAVRRIVAHFGLTADERFFSEIARSPAMTTYSKAPEHAYSPELRGRVLADSRARNASEIRKGLAWLETTAKGSPRIAEILSRAG